MRVKWQGFFGKNHSWSEVARSITRSLISKNHSVDIFSTNGLDHIPNDLLCHIVGYQSEETKQSFGRLPSGNYDIQLTYSSLKNFTNYLSHGKANRFGIWSYEWIDKNVLPDGFAKHYSACDKLLAPSQWSKIGFINSGIPENRIEIVPHGIDVNQYSNNTTIKIPTDRKFKILANIAQLHLRKNINGLLDAYGKAFTKKDDVCLVLKGKHKKLMQPFDVSLNAAIDLFNKKYRNHAEIIVMDNFIDDMSSLYRSVDATFTMSHCEAFYMVGLEGLAAGKISIAPNYGGQLEYMNGDNSLLIDGRMDKTPANAMYWGSKPNATWYVPSIDDAVDKLRFAYANYESLNAKIDKQYYHEKYNWNVITDQILGLCK